MLAAVDCSVCLCVSVFLSVCVSFTIIFFLGLPHLKWYDEIILSKNNKKLHTMKIVVGLCHVEK